jgi:hypothetical protein
MDEKDEAKGRLRKLVRSIAPGIQFDESELLQAERDLTVDAIQAV